MSLPYGETVTVWREIMDKFGDVTALVEQRTVDGCGVEQRRSTEDNAGRVQVATGRTLYAPPGAGITATSRVRLADGTTWRVIGDPAAHRSPLTGRYPGDTVELERVTG